MSGNPDILEYYKNEHSKKPLRIINLNFCEQVGTSLTFNKKELQGSFVFDIKTSEHTFYVMAETEANMNKWVQSICQICDFTSRKSSIPSHSGQPTLLPPVSSHIQPALSTSTKHARGASLPQGTWQKSDTAVQKLAQGSLASYSHMKGSLTGYETENEDVYTFKTPNNTLCQEFRDLLMDNRESASWSAEFPGKTINKQGTILTIPMSPGNPPGHPSTALPIHRGPSQGSEIQPPPVNCDLKPDRKTKPTPLDLHLSPSLGPGSTTPLTPAPPSTASPSLHKASSTQTQEMQTPVSASPVPSGTDSPAPKKGTGKVNYIALDFQSDSLSPYRKPSTSSVTLDKKIGYAQVDKEKTQALQTTIQKWTDM
ncbi:hypothetical protein A6R68_01628 [Neotoma lepida]|uniref:PH domain-containing protein n=1 Tax=Neotoma lepida TaxID=56216 RepID=A0A1A6GW34_NEOLE|nr:hypothetical protein A6R68_01628 [Neotoma lepida]